MVSTRMEWIPSVFSGLLGQGFAAGLVREGDAQQANGEGNRGEGDRRSERAQSGHSTSEATIHPGTDEAADRRAEGEGGCARFGAEQLRQP